MMARDYSIQHPHYSRSTPVIYNTKWVTVEYISNNDSI